VRGFTTSEFYQDGFSANRGYPSTPDAANLERIEVLKGPAASLYGRGDPGGTVNIVTKKPQPDAFTTLQTSAGSWDRYRTALDVNTPLDSEGQLLTRVNLAVEDNHSFRDHVDAKRVFVAPSFSWQLAPDTHLLVESEFVRHRSTFDRARRAARHVRAPPSSASPTTATSTTTTTASRPPSNITSTTRGPCAWPAITNKAACGATLRKTAR